MHFGVNIATIWCAMHTLIFTVCSTAAAEEHADLSNIHQGNGVIFSKKSHHLLTHTHCNFFCASYKNLVCVIINESSQ